jgi:hypothetical protein
MGSGQQGNLAQLPGQAGGGGASIFLFNFKQLQ